MVTLFLFLVFSVGQLEDTTARVPHDTVSTRGGTADTLREVRPPGHPVILAEDTLFLIYSPLGEFEAEERARQVVGRLRMLARDSRPLDSLTITENEGVSDVLLESLRVFSVTRRDAATIGLDRDSAAAQYRAVIIAAVQDRRSRSGSS